MTSFEDNRWRLERREDERVEYILRDLVVQGPLPRDGDGLFKYSSGVDQNDLVDEAPRYCYKKVGLMQLKLFLKWELSFTLVV
jgi:hypothetical protein